jgi:phosphate transport system permease protein
MVVAVPLGLSSAIYPAEYATPKAASILRLAVEILAGIPTVVYGYFALISSHALTTEFFTRRGF